MSLAILVSKAQVVEELNDTTPEYPHPSLPPMITTGYDDLMSPKTALDLRVPSNIRTEVEYDPGTDTYTIYQKIGDWNVSEPLILTAQEYHGWQTSLAMENYWRSKQSETIAGKTVKNPFNPLDMNFALGKLDRIFGPGGLSLRTRGNVQIKTGINSNKTGNPALSVQSRRKTYFDFDQKIQATVNASVGTKLNFNLTYNTDATFDFDAKNLKLAYEGEEDEIVKSIEAGNVSMTTGSSLIRGSTSLFGIKGKLQFGRLTATALVSQQNSESRSVSTRGGAQMTEFEIPANEYDQNRHFFLAHWFRDNYDRFAADLPLISSGVNITRVEVWVTNMNGNFSQTRNLVAFQDLGENQVMASDYWIGDPAYPFPTNSSNNLLSTIKSEYPEARNINRVTQVLSPLSAYGIEGGSGYEKVESARLLDESEYTVNTTLGYISLRGALSSDEVLAVAFEYTRDGKVYQVGEFSSDITTTDDALFVKMLRATTISTKFPMWKLMMKNIYSLGAYSINESNFKLQIKYLSDSTGIKLPYLPIPWMSHETLLQVISLDKLDSNSLGNPDGFFDFIEGYTIMASTGKIIFPVVEPFGEYLEYKIGDPATAEKYVYKELYDSTYTVAAQFSDKNKFFLTGEYQSSSGSQIRLNAINVPRGSVVVTAGSTVLTENVDYTVDYSMGVVTITNQSIIDSGQNISVTLENQALYSTQRKTLLGLDLQYELSRNFNIGGTILHFSEKALTEKVNIGDEVINNTMWGLNLSYNKQFMWLTNLLNKIPTVNATAPSALSVNAEFAQLIPHGQKEGSAKGSSYIDDFEESQTGIDLRSPYAWQLSSTPYEQGPGALFPEAALSNNVDYGKNRALLAWNYIDRMFTARNSTLCPGYIKSDLKQLSNPYVREVTSREIFPGRELSYGESSIIQTLNLSFYPTERGPYNVDAVDIDSDFNLLNPEKRWGGIMRKMEMTNFEQSNIEYLQFWLMSPFLDPENPNYEGGDLYFNFGDISEDILKDGMKSYENGIPVDGVDTYLTETVWGRVSKQASLTYSFDNATTARAVQDVGLDGLINLDEYGFPTYGDYLEQLRRRLSSTTIARLEQDQFSPFNDPAGDNYHFFRGEDYDAQRLSILERYKHYNGVEGNSLTAELTGDPMYQSSRNTPDVEDINQDNTLNEYERYFQYKVSIRPEDFVVGKNFITDKQVSLVHTRDGENVEVEWYQFKIPLNSWQKKVGSIQDFTTIRFARMFLTGFRNVTHLRFGTLELVRGEWREFSYDLNSKGQMTPDGEMDVSVVNIEENASREPVNYVLPPGVTRIIDPSQSQITQLNEQSLSLKVTGLEPGSARGIYRNTQLDLRNYSKLQMWIHAEALIDNPTDLQSGDLALVVRMGSDSKNNYYQYEIPLMLTPPGSYNNNLPSDRYLVWPLENFMNLNLQNLVDLKSERNKRAMSDGDVSYSTLYTNPDPSDGTRLIGVLGNPSLSDVRVIVIGVQNGSSMPQSGTVWINELKVTDFNESGGWAAKANVNLAVSDVATLNVGVHRETAGFGNVDQSLNERRMDDYSQLSLSVQSDLGRFFPQGAKLRAPIYYSMSNEKITPKYNPLDQDVLLKDALDAVSTKEQKDSIKSRAVERSESRAFSISGLNFGVRSVEPMPWDPANFTISFSFNKQSFISPTTQYENTNDYRGSLSYNYSPNPKYFRPFSSLGSESPNLRFLKEWEFCYVPANISFLTTMTRYYYEQQERSAIDEMFKLPVSVSKNFLWDRQFNISWNLTRQLSFSYSSNTTARIEETVGAVNKKLFPDEYKAWKDTVWKSILHLGTPWAFNQSFNATYRAPFNRIPVLDFISAQGSYNSLYSWDRGTTVNFISTGNSIASQGTWNAEGRINFEGLYNKIPYLKSVNERFNPSQRNRSQSKKARKVERTYTVRPDSTIKVRHSLRTKRVRISVTDEEGKPVRVNTSINSNNEVGVTYRSKNDRDTVPVPLKVTVTEILANDKSLWKNIADYSARVAMSVRNISIRYRNNRSLSLPLFANDIGDIFGQSVRYGPLSPGLDFAFGFISEDYIDKAKSRGWLITDNGQTSPALWSRANEMNIEIGLEPIKGLRIVLTSNRTENRTSQIQFMFAHMPSSMGGSYTKTHWALASALRSSSAGNGYRSSAFEKFLEYIPIVAQRVQGQYNGTVYPSKGFLEGTAYAGQLFNPMIGEIPATSSDVLIPAFIAAYSGYSPESVNLSPFPSFKYALPNWRVTYDGLLNIGNLSNIFKLLTLTHAYQCTYTIGSYSSFMNWQSAGVASADLGFIQDELTGAPVPSSPYNISSVAITERFAPLIGVNVTFSNDISGNIEWRDQRTLTLNSSSGQIIEATTRGIVIGAGYKIIGFNSFLKLKGKQTGVSNDLTLNAEFSWQDTQALIRRIETAYTQPTSGTRTLGVNLTANYILSKRFTIGAYFDHQVNTPLVTAASYPTTNTSFGLLFNLSLSR